ncbi:MULTISPECIES: cytochrome c biogenesis heme-transporting ATPase CcmA [Idiomarinaceae]|uniref:Cytochrome c biogenesis heme-transporting ATPase CcmA n=1 Tax=Pseudidiomarina sp. PP-1MA TaxID=3237706 RepID=A0AB39X8Q8_9GAMM|nr:MULTISPECIES: cytochrome c biogenesis heme-transporting ATPase CcmA [Idiomarina]MRJ41240.1 cytochrome c biogenesis heme-transporting ATPase CcmA [Idiomarina sp. FeN1]NCU56405.1 cytochrome c biogenesis heme-transporting ATPase CcmA [Idiomarina sp. FenA--70]NCU59424.1 cytochrome c biogenesis heme-transporting ATPase CcmA [Idiomarina sp. FenBw--71]UUN12598.1 cytochrome c biogenesis heme-transporting ATPase CcmA [Idiomarina loihiensis]
MSVVIQADQLTSVRAGRTLFAQLSLQLNAGHILHIEGPNGAGKSTLLRIIAGLLRPQEGQVRLFGQPQRDDPELWQRQTLFIGHKPAVKAELTALENLHFQAQLDGAGAIDPWQLLETVGLLGLEDIPAQQLSAGQQRRIALARLWYSPATLWILDEPFTALDTRGIDMLHQRFAEHLERGGALLLTSHQPLTWSGERLQKLRIEPQDEEFVDELS